MSVDKSRENAWREMQRRHGRPADEPAPELPLKGGRGGGTYDDMEGRVARLEAYMEVSREDMRELKGDLKAIIGKFGTIPTKTDLDTWKWQWLLGSVAIFAVIIGSILGGLAWLDG